MKRGLQIATVALALAACDNANDRMADNDPLDDADAARPSDTYVSPGPATDPLSPAPGMATPNRGMADTDGDLVADADDTGRNENDSGLTPTDQSGSATDVEITRSIREKVVAGEEEFSTDAQNVKVITDAGVVTLRGPVENEREKRAIAEIARKTAGVTGVNDQLEVATR
jgi:hyperosmotically inducible protein